MITILIRTSYRPTQFARLIASINRQTYKDINVIVSYDDDKALNYIRGYERIRVNKSKHVRFYDDYCNELKRLVNRGYFVFIDDDDYLINEHCLADIWKYLQGKNGVICQFSRAGRLKPSNEEMKIKRIALYRIGMPCLFLHYSHKNLADLDGSQYAADYTWIKKVSEQVKLVFVPIPVVYAEERSRGAIEQK